MNIIFSNIERTWTCSSIGDRTRTPYFWLRTNEHRTKKAFTIFTKSLIELTQTSIFRTSNELERVHLLVIELEHPIFGFEHWTLFDPSLFRKYVTQLRQEIGNRLVDRVFDPNLTSDGKPSKWWICFSKRKFMKVDLNEAWKNDFTKKYDFSDFVNDFTKIHGKMSKNLIYPYTTDFTKKFV